MYISCCQRHDGPDYKSILKVILKPRNIVFCTVSLFVAGLNVKYVYPQVVCDIDS